MDYQVFRRAACLETSAEMDEEIPLRLRELLKESRLLYLRILRLDDTFREQSARRRHAQKSYEST